MPFILPLQICFMIIEKRFCQRFLHLAPIIMKLPFGPTTTFESTKLNPFCFEVYCSVQNWLFLHYSTPLTHSCCPTRVHLTIELTLSLRAANVPRHGLQQSGGDHGPRGIVIILGRRRDDGAARGRWDARRDGHAPRGAQEPAGAQARPAGAYGDIFRQTEGRRAAFAVVVDGRRRSKRRRREESTRHCNGNGSPSSPVGAETTMSDKGTERRSR